VDAWPSGRGVSGAGLVVGKVDGHVTTLFYHEPVKNNLLSVVDPDIKPVATNIYRQIRSASIRLRSLRRLIPISELSTERNGGSYGAVFYADTVEDRDDYQDLGERYLLTVQGILAGQIK
jgi:hypothetical protein